MTYQAEYFLEKNIDDIANAELVINSSSMPLLSEQIAANVKRQRMLSSGSGNQRKASVSCGRKFSTALKALRLRIEETQPSFIRCIKPNDRLVADSFNSKSVVEQLRCAGVLSAVQVSRAGFSTRFTHEKFMNKYFMLAPKATTIQVRA